MKIHDLLQGSPEWHAHRANYLNASDAPAMMGVSPYKTRGELLHEKHTGLTPAVTPEQERIFAAGHAYEAQARPLAELITGKPLYPVVGTEGQYGASFDGIDMAEQEVFEHKSLNDTLRACMPANDGVTVPEDVVLPDLYRIQNEHGLMVSGARRVLFMASKWSGDQLVEERHCWYYADLALRARIVAGWQQFASDLAAYIPPELDAAKPVGKAPETLPALRIEVTGLVKASNLTQFKATALAVIRSVNRELKSDEDFAHAEKAVKWCEDVESSLAAGKQHALSQTETIDALFRAIDEISAEARDVRLELQKLVKARKEAIKGEIVAGAVQAWVKHLDTLDPAIPRIQPDWAGVIKSKRTVASIRDSVDTELARCKIEANQWFTLITKNRATLAEHPDHGFLFSDIGALVLKQPDDLALVIRTRVADHQAKEEKRLEAERERIRAEEQAKAQRETEAAERSRQAAIALQAVASTPVPTPTPVVVAADASVGILARGESAAGKALVPRPAPAGQNEPATLKLGTICERLGFTITAAFVADTLGIQHRATDKAAKLYSESDWPRICWALRSHITAMETRSMADEVAA